MRASRAQHDVHAIGFGRAVSRAPSSPRIAAVTLAPCRSQMHPGVYKLALASWVMFLAVFWVTFAVSANALFQVAIGTVYAIMFFGVPFLMSRIAGHSGSATFPLRDFLDGRFDTLNGPIGGREALVQVIMVPFALTLGGVAIGFIIHAARLAS